MNRMHKILVYGSMVMVLISAIVTAWALMVASLKEPELECRSRCAIQIIRPNGSTLSWQFDFSTKSWLGYEVLDQCRCHPLQPTGGYSVSY